MDFAERLEELSRKVSAHIGKALKEEATKNALVQPFLEVLGYDPRNIEEVEPEYDAGMSNHKDARVDYAVLSNGKPIMLFECKALGTPLEKCATQLQWYFSSTDAHIGILTDGNRYLFYSDIDKPNCMDAKPYMSITMSDLDKSLVPELRNLCKGRFNPVAILDAASNLKFNREFKQVMAAQIENPEPEFLRFFVGKVYDGKFTQKAQEYFTPLLSASLRQFIDEKVNERLANAMSATSSKAAPNAPETPEAESIEEKGTDSGIVTHNTEMWAYIAIRALLSKYVEPVRIAMHDYKSYCSIQLDDNKFKPIARLYNFAHWEEGMDNIGKNARILILTKSNTDGESYPLRYVDDIYPLVDRLAAAVARLENGEEASEGDN